jgi:hypothetical protein
MRECSGAFGYLILGRRITPALRELRYKMSPDDDQLPLLDWMPSRVPARDALIAFIPDNETPPDAPYDSGETRWYPVAGGLRMAVPYDGQPFSSPRFQVGKGFWDHTTCDRCKARIEAMELCYVTPHGHYIGLCLACYNKKVVARLGSFRSLAWRLKGWFGLHAAA